MSKYRIFNHDDAIAFAHEHSGLFDVQSKPHCEEFGDGNLNLVFRITNDKGSSLIVKQALPYARCVGESWPLTTDRARIEAEVLILHGQFCPEHTVKILHFDAGLSAILMEDLHDYRILRGELVTGKRFPHFASQIATYLARTLFYTSDFYLDGPGKKARVAQFINPELCLITEDLFFTDPFCDHERNNIHVEIQAEAQQLWSDEPLKAEIAALKADFLSRPQALLHGDVHSGSIFINDKNIKVIDAEFGFYGPIGFDVGSVIGNLLLNYSGHYGLTSDPDIRATHHAYLFAQITTLWQQFSANFSRLLATETRDPAFKNSLYQQRFLQQVFTDAIGYAGSELIRRTVGLAHVADLDKITDAKQRAASERLSLTLGRALILQREGIHSTAQLLDLVTSLSAGQV